MAINRLNHAVLYVRDAERSAASYTDALGVDDQTRAASAANRPLDRARASVGTRLTAGWRRPSGRLTAWSASTSP